MKKQLFLKHSHTNPLVWLAAVICAVFTVVVIITGVTVLSVYLAYRPKMPYIKVREAHLGRLSYDQAGLLDVQMTVTMEAGNRNNKADATFSDIDFELRFNQTPIARLRADAFHVGKNSTVLLPYVVDSPPVRLLEEGMEKMDEARKLGRVLFELGGQARTRWRVGVFLSVGYWTHVDCELRYFYPNGSSTDLDCTSKCH